MTATVDPILRLLDVRGALGQLREDDDGGFLKLQPGPSGFDGDERRDAPLVVPEPIHRLAALRVRGRAVDADERREKARVRARGGGVRAGRWDHAEGIEHLSLNRVEDFLVMREDDDAGALRLRDVVRVRARVRVRVASQPEVLAEPVAAPGEFLQRDRLRFGFFRFATGGGRRVRRRVRRRRRSRSVAPRPRANGSITSSSSNSSSSSSSSSSS